MQCGLARYFELKTAPMDYVYSMRAVFLFSASPEQIP